MQHVEPTEQDHGVEGFDTGLAASSLVAPMQIEQHHDDSEDGCETADEVSQEPQGAGRARAHYYSYHTTDV